MLGKINFEAVICIHLADKPMQINMSESIGAAVRQRLTSIGEHLDRAEDAIKNARWYLQNLEDAPESLGEDVPECILELFDAARNCQISLTRIDGMYEGASIAHKTLKEKGLLCQTSK